MLNSPEVKIITTEDPVEYRLPGVIQVKIKEDIGLTFNICLRHILRQDPDIILVGEIRDLETAEMAIHASLTGHMVLSTLHTNDAPGTITRLIDMEVEPFLLCSTIRGILAQRLVRTICPNCKESYVPEKKELEILNIKKKDMKDVTFYHGRGCNSCDGSGYKGQTGIFELLLLDDEIRTLIMNRAPTKDVRNKALEMGFKSMAEDGLNKIYRGITTIREVADKTQQ
jgi:type II secretory ATPase GspE/PulE/Tfp pilus assembly ATPase PilB-like protein